MQRIRSRFARSKRCLVKTIALAGALISGLAIAGPAVASAAYIGSNVGYAYVRTCPYIQPSCGITATLRNGQGVNMVKWCDAMWVTGDYYSNRWFKINWPVSGWVHSSYVEAQQRVGWGCTPW